MTSSRPIAPDLMEHTAEGLRLVGGRRLDTGKIVFPLPEAERSRFERVLLAPRGKLWSWTVQRFRPKTPPYGGPGDDKNFDPYIVGYIELPGEVIVEARIDAAASGGNGADLAIGTPMEVVEMPFSTDPDGTVVTTYGFRPSVKEQRI